jgi:hypothetical protein
MFLDLDIKEDSSIAAIYNTGENLPTENYLPLLIDITTGFSVITSHLFTGSIVLLSKVL